MYTVKKIKEEIKMVKNDNSLTSDEKAEKLESLYIKLGDLESIEAEQRYLNGGEQ